MAADSTNPGALRRLPPGEITTEEVEGRPVDVERRGRRLRVPSLGRRVGTLGALAIAFGALLLVAIPALAVHEEGFQLEGNIDSQNVLTGAASPLPSALVAPFNGPIDWYDSSVAGGGPNGIFKVDSSGNASPNSPLPTTPNKFIAAGFVQDFNYSGSSFVTSDLTTYTQGSKDINDIGTWACVSVNNVTNKGDITNAYATMEVVGGQRYVYFAMEKDTVNGDNNVGFWFLQDPNVGCQTPASGNGNKWTGTHKDGDIFVVAAFTNGGGISTISAYVWNNGALTGPVESGVDCLLTSANDNICATTNRTSITPPWLHANNKTVGYGTSVSIPTAAFFEGGINLDDPKFGFSSQCFSSFVADTRSSQSTSATLYDYAQGNLSTCGDVTINKTTHPSNSGTDSFSYTTTGGAPLTGFSLDTNPTTTTPASQFFGSVPPGNYTVTEGATSGWNLSDLTCTKNGSPFTGSDTTSTATGEASWAMGYGDHIVCAYTNVKPGARISIGTSGTNQVGHEHTFTVTVEQNANGDGTTWTPAAGVVLTPSVTGLSGASLVTADTTCNTTGTDASGQCVIAVNSTATGTATVNASGNVVVGGVTIPVATNGANAYVGHISNQKTWVDARISIGTSGTNQVGHPHTFTVTVEQNDGTGWGAASGVDVTGATDFGTLTTGTCTTNGSGQCDLVVTSSTPGTATVNASATVDVSGVSIGVATDGYGADSVSNQKTWVDANIQISPLTATNLIGVTHTLTAHVNVNAGSGAGYVSAPDGTEIDFSIVSGPGSLSASSCVTSGGTGSCSVDLTNLDTAGTTVVNASTTVSVGGVSLTRSTNDGLTGDSDNAEKIWKTGEISITKTIETGPFTTDATVCFQLNLTSAGSLVTSSDNPQCYEFKGGVTSHTFTWEGLAAGTYSIDESSVTPPYVALSNPVASNITLDNTHLTYDFGTVNNPLPPGSLMIKKLLNGQTYTGGSGTFTFAVSYCGSDSTCASPTFLQNVTIDGTTNPITISSLDEGYYLVQEINVPYGFSVTSANPQVAMVFAGDTCSSSADPGVTCPAQLPVTVTFNNQPTTFGQITPTGTTCSQFAGGTASTLTQANYSTSGGLISTDNPGVFFYYDKLVAPGGAFTITVNQTNSAGSTYNFHVLNDDTNQMTLYDANCNKISSVTENASNPAAVTFQVPSSTNGQIFYIGVKYTPKSVVGLAVLNPVPNPWTYTYSTTVGANLVPGSTQSLSFVGS